MSRRRLIPVFLLLAGYASTIGSAPRLEGGTEPRTFRRGDVDGDGFIDLTDAAFHLFSLFAPLDLACEDAADVDDSGRLTFDDPVYLLTFLLRGGPAPPPPFPECGVDRRIDDDLGCLKPHSFCDEVRTPVVDPGYRLRISAPATVSGAPGSRVTFDATVHLFVPGDGRVNAWNVVARADPPCRIVKATIEGTVLDENRFEVEIFEQTDIVGPSSEAHSSVVFLNTGSPVTVLFPNLSHRILQLTVEAEVPPAAAARCELQFVATGSPKPAGFVSNAVTTVVDPPNFDVTRVLPLTVSRTVLICPEIEPGEPIDVVFPAGESQALYKFRCEPGQRSVVRLREDPRLGQNSVYIRYGAPPTPGLYDYAFNRPAEGVEPRVVIPYTRAGDCFVLVQASDTKQGSTRLLVECSGGELLLEALSVTSVTSVLGRLPACILGAGFDEQTSFRLEHVSGGVTIPTVETNRERTVIVTSGRAHVVFGLNRPLQGLYHLVASTPERRAVLENAFEVTGTSLGELFDLDLVMSDVYRLSYERVLKLVYRNHGDGALEAPLLKIAGSRGTRFKLAGTEDWREDELQVLAVHSGAVPGVLPPGGTGELSIIYQSDNPGMPTGDGTGNIITLEVQLFTPDRRAAVPWTTAPRPPGATAEEWEQATECTEPTENCLPGELGATWRSYRRALGRLGDRLALRGIHPASVLEAYRFAVREVYGRPSAAILGTVRDRFGNPLANRAAAAFDSRGDLVSSALTDSRGDFAIDWIPGGDRYTVRFRDLRVVDPPDGFLTVSVQPRRETPTFDTVAAPEANAVPLGCPACDERGLPEDPLEPPAELFTTISRRDVFVVASLDPNDKEGSAGQGEGDLECAPSASNCAPDVLFYEIQFENLAPDDPPDTSQPCADRVPAQSIDVFDDLRRHTPGAFDPLVRLDFQSAGVGSQVVALASQDPEGNLFSGSLPPSGTTDFGAYAEIDFAELDLELDLDPSINTDSWFVSIEATFDPLAETLRWEFRTRDRDLPPGSDLVDTDCGGFLPPNFDEPEGEGFVGFSVGQSAFLQTAEQLENDADITFDLNEVITTPVSENLVCGDLLCAIHPVPADGATEVGVDTALLWEGRGLSDEYRVFLFRSGEPRTLVATTPIEGFQPPAALDLGATYVWQIESVKEGVTQRSAEWTFTTEGVVGPFRRGDCNADSRFDLSDVVTILFFNFLGGPAPKCAAACDMDRSGTIQGDTTDAIVMLSALFLGNANPPPPFPNCGLGELQSDALLGCVELPAGCL